ncbi:signal peptidase I [Abyssisolibacter fermentans]|uniref:signal peptidase I n=1 Tax=Abyssisolibacter fermentans TaxID=1766203 RepID=UPI00082DB811|nr:signal peptidase I [Abyssisolibacter fermentans]
MNKSKSILREIIEWIAYLLGVVIIVVLLNSEVYGITQVKQWSMENTLIQNDRLYLDKIKYHFSEPKAGDIIVFLQGEVRNGFKDRISNVIEDLTMKFTKKVRRNRYVKRVIAVAGDEVMIKNNKVYINGVELNEPYVKGSTFEGRFKLPAVVPEGKVFAMGDNRQRSSDSREFGFVDIKSIEGKAIFRFWPLDKLGKIK